MDVDREAFLALVFAMAGCGAQPTPEPVVVVTAPPPPDAGAITIAAPPPTSEPEAPKVSEATACQKQNDEGEVDCSPFDKGPTCEGFHGVCNALAEGTGFRKKAASVAAKCLARLGKNACNIQMRKKCYAEGLAASCPEPEFESFCEQKMGECKAKHLTPSYTKEGCMRAMAGQKAGGDRNWAMSAMGPSGEGKCELMFTVF